MKSRHKKIVRKKIRSKLSRKKKRSNAKNKKMKGGAMPLDNYNTLVFGVDDTILPRLCEDGDKYDDHYIEYFNFKTTYGLSPETGLRELHKMIEYSNKMINRIIEYKDQILTLIKKLLEIKKKKSNIKLVILTRWWLKYTLKNHHALYYAPELTVRELFKDHPKLKLTPAEWEEIFEKIITERGREGFTLREDKNEVVGITYETFSAPLQEIMGGGNRRHDEVRKYEISIIFILKLFFDDFYDMSELYYNCDDKPDACKRRTDRQHDSPLWSAVVKASYFKNFVLEQDKEKVLFFDDEYINTMFVYGLGYNCVSPTKVENEKGQWAVGWVNDALEYLLNEPSDPESIYASQSTYFITSKMDLGEKEKYKTEVITAMSSETSEDPFTKKVLASIKKHHFKGKTNATLFSELYKHFMTKIPSTIFYKCKDPNRCGKEDTKGSDDPGPHVNENGNLSF